MAGHAAICRQVGATEPLGMRAQGKTDDRGQILRGPGAIHDLHVLFGARAQCLDEIPKDWCVDRTGTDTIHVDPAVAPGPPVLHGPDD